MSPTSNFATMLTTEPTANQTLWLMSQPVYTVASPKLTKSQADLKQILSKISWDLISREISRLCCLRGSSLENISVSPFCLRRDWDPALLICYKFGPLFFGQEERAIRAIVFHTIQVRASELCSSCIISLCTYSTDAARDSVIVYFSMFGAQSGVVMSSILSTWAIRVVVFFVRVRALELHYWVCASSLTNTISSIPVFFSGNLSPKWSGGRWVEYESFGTWSVSSLF